MEESILTSIKKLLGISEDDESFDQDILMHINSVLFVLCQLGVGPDTAYSIDDSSVSWVDYLGEDLAKYESIKTYIYLRVRLLFDPPTNGSVLAAIERQVAEYEWRLNIQAES